MHERCEFGWLVLDAEAGKLWQGDGSASRLSIHRRNRASD
jgi:hypothetical protein